MQTRHVELSFSSIPRDLDKLTFQQREKYEKARARKLGEDNADVSVEKEAENWSTLKLKSLDALNPEQPENYQRALAKKLEAEKEAAETWEAERQKPNYPDMMGPEEREKFERVRTKKREEEDAHGSKDARKNRDVARVKAEEPGSLDA